MQKECFDSNPTTGGTSGTGVIRPTGATIANVFDGNLTSKINWIYGFSDRGFVNVTGFKKPSDNGLTDFNITFIDIKVHYRAIGMAISDDQYRIVLYFGGATVELLTWVAGQDAAYPHFWDNPETRVFPNLPKPGGGNWTWTDLENFKIGFENRVVGTNNFQNIYVHEIWITAYSTPYPDAGTMSVQPPCIWGLSAGNMFYVDIHLTNVTHMWGYELLLGFYSSVLTPISWHTYNPFTAEVRPSEIGEDFLVIGYKTYQEDPVGFTGSTPIVRIYFQINVATGSPLHFISAEWCDVQGNPFTLRTVDGYYRISEGDFEPPTIETVARMPRLPNYDEDVTVVANVTDNVEVDSVTLSTNLTSEWHNITMNQYGSQFSATISARPYGTTVQYRIYANDTSGNWAVSDTFSYRVSDRAAPQISSSRNPAQPRANQMVEITANVTEPANASGVRSVTLYHRDHGQPSLEINMTYNPQSGLWEANIPSQPAHAQIEYYLVARDNADNRNVTETYSYTVALAGDANLDHVVDVVDAAVISAHWYPGPPIGPLGYDPSFDLNNDGIINILDAAMVSADWNKTW